MTLRTDIASDIAGDHVYFDVVAGFAVTATLEDSSTIPVRLINDPTIGDLGETRVNMSTPRAYARTSEAPAIDTLITIDSVEYCVTHAEPYPNGRTLLHLHET